MISDEKRFVFVHIPRTAGTSIETALAPYAREPVGYTVGGNTVLAHKHATAAELRGLVGDAFWASAFTFSIVRDPWARMYSDYNFFHDVGPRLLDEFSDLERWLTALALSEPFTRWLRTGADRLDIAQSSYLTDADGALLVDFVGRFETLGGDFEAICRSVGVERALPHVNGTRRRDFRAAYDADSVALVGRYAAADIDRFGYGFSR